MTEVFIDPTKNNIAIQVLSQSLHAVGFTITVFAADGNTVLEQLSGNTQNSNPFTQNLSKAPSTYKGCFVGGTFAFISPDGTDGTYRGQFSLLLDTAVVHPDISMSGMTSGGSAMTMPNFHLN